MMTHPLITDFVAPACVRSNNDLDGSSEDHLNTESISFGLALACESDAQWPTREQQSIELKGFPLLEMVHKN